MKQIFKTLVLLLFAAFPAQKAFSQWDSQRANVRISVPEIAMMDIEPDISTVKFEINAPSEAGEGLTVETQTIDELWINYSSAITPSGQKRSITAQISSGTIPSGMAFYIQASAASAFGSANQGVSTGKIEVSETPKPIISNIGSCYTGNGINMGHELNYILEISDFSELDVAGDYSFTVTYTITDN